MKVFFRGNQKTYLEFCHVQVRVGNLLHHHPVSVHDEVQLGAPLRARVREAGLAAEDAVPVDLGYGLHVLLGEAGLVALALLRLLAVGRAH